MLPNPCARISKCAGIAIGPILFVVAILAVLAIAIAADSGTFANNSNQEANRTNAGAILQIGETMKIATDRIIGLGNDLTTVTQTGANTGTDIFSITGGGLSPPSTALAATPATDTWIFTWAPVAGMGTAANDKVAFLKVSQGVCDQLNVIGANTTTNAVGFNPTGTGISTSAVPAWDPVMTGKFQGCIHTVTTTPGYYFFQVLGTQ